MYRPYIRSLFLLLGLLVSSAALALEPVYTGFFSDKAVSGYDPVAYFTLGKPTKGNAKYTYEHQGATWYFVNAENLASFKQAPEKYSPQFGGYCAWAVSQGSTASADPNYWKIVDGKLYLNYDQNVQEKWEKSIDSFIESANKNWPGLLAK